MFSRYTISLLPSDLEKNFHVRVPDDYYPHFNAAAGQLLPLVLNQRHMEITMGYWGFHSHITSKIIPEESLTLHLDTIKTSERWASFLHERRCLVIADGFYLWKKVSSTRRTPFRVMPKANNPICFAGIWQSFPSDKSAEERIEYMILTRKTYKPINNISDHMPVVMSREAGMLWIRPNQSFDDLMETMEAEDWNFLKYYPVSPAFDNQTINNPSLIKPSPVTDQYGNLRIFE